MTELLLLGSSGRMGSEIKALVSAGSDFKIAHEVFAGSGDLESFRPNNKTVAVDFSHPDLTAQFLSKNRQWKIPLVTGTTGFSEKQFADVKAAAVETPVFFSANFSVGIASLAQMIKNFPKSLASWDVSVEEIHHSQKKDAPSGTAKTIHQELEQWAGRKVTAPVSIRGGGVFGDHSIFLLSPDEMIRIEHRALNRRVFASGALRAAQWIRGKSAGKLYSMADMIQGA